MQFAVVFFEEAGRLLDVVVHRVFWNRQTKVLLDPAALLQRGRFQVNPDRLEARKLFQRFDFFLEQAAVGQGEDVEHGSASGGRGERGWGRPRGDSARFQLGRTGSGCVGEAAFRSVARQLNAPDGHDVFHGNAMRVTAFDYVIAISVGFLGAKRYKRLSAIGERRPIKTIAFVAPRPCASPVSWA